MGTTRIETWEPCIREKNYSLRSVPTPQITITQPWGTRNASVDVPQNHTTYYYSARCGVIYAYVSRTDPWITNCHCCRKKKKKTFGWVPATNIGWIVLLFTVSIANFHIQKRSDPGQRLHKMSAKSKFLTRSSHQVSTWIAFSHPKTDESWSQSSTYVKH